MVYRHRPEPVRRAVPARVAARLREMLEGVVDGVPGATVHYQVAFPEVLVKIVVRDPERDGVGEWGMNASTSCLRVCCSGFCSCVSALTYRLYVRRGEGA